MTEEFSREIAFTNLHGEIGRLFLTRAFDTPLANSLASCEHFSDGPHTLASALFDNRYFTKRASCRAEPYDLYSWNSLRLM